MKNLIFLLFATTLIWSACSKTDLAEDRNPQELMWTVSDGDHQLVIQDINSSQSSITLEMNPNTICGGHGVQLTIVTGNNTIIESSINSFPFTQTFDVDQNSDIKITTAYDDSGALILCDLATIIDIKVIF